jgi:glycosyltransferase involved in cell wall biosynthesis
VLNEDCLIPKLARLKVSVIIPAFNEERLIGDTLDRVKTAMSAFSQRDWEIELIVCDNNSTDRTAEIAQAAGATVVFEPVNQIARARNRGAETASGDWLIFIDADTFPSPDLFATVAREIDGGRCLAGGCLVRYDKTSWLLAGLLRGWNRLSQAKQWMAGSFIFCEAKAFRQIGGFNLELFESEEIDLSERLKKLARETSREIVILREVWVLTSARKLRLYSLWEHLWFLAHVCVRPRGALRDRTACHRYWYDGRR